MLAVAVGTDKAMALTLPLETELWASCMLGGWVLWHRPALQRLWVLLFVCLFLKCTGISLAEHNFDVSHTRGHTHSQTLEALQHFYPLCKWLLVFPVQ